jgi:hypothetical protein
MAVVWGGTISKPVGGDSTDSGHYSRWQAVLFMIAAFTCAALLAFEALR